MESFYAYYSLVTGIFLFLLTLVVLLGNPNHKLNKAWTPVILSISVWSTGLSQEILAQDKGTALFWNQVFYTGGVWIAPFFVRFAAIFSERPSRTGFIKSSFVLAVILNLVLIFKLPWFIKDLTKVFVFRNWNIPGPGYYAFALFFTVYMTYANWLLWQHFRKSQGFKR